MHQEEDERRKNDEILSDIANMAHAFRQANDEDTRLALNAISSKSDTDMAAIAYYVMPTAWMQAAWGTIMPVHSPGTSEEPRVVSENWRVHLGPVSVGRLLNVNPPPPRLFHHLVYGGDYVLVGPNLWLLLKEKFGSDTELRLPVTRSDAGETGLAVRASGTVLIALPATARFPYEHMFGPRRSESGGGSGGNDDNDDAEGVGGWPEFASSPKFSSLAQAAAAAPGNVSDDDETDSLFPNGDSHPRDDPLASSPVLLLPMSTTYSPVRPTAARKSTLRPHGSGLGNLGNTCFMNSTLQCLAHTGPLRKYFLSGAYRSDLNTKNPLGTAGDLAEHFAQLLAEMWVSTDEYSVRNNVVYPRSFKFALGRHADQFVGYDQHDSQELASYLLDALHEDTNRVTVKPYVEKPEQEEGESDEHASAKALSLHEKREDSYIHRLFVGQVKSRIQCSQEGCGRVSTTFDPFLFLSLPIPGSSERNLRVRFVPLDPALRIQELTIRIEKVASVRELVSKALQQLDSLGIVSNVDIDDILPADIWQKEVYEVLELSSSVERIRDNDETYLFQLTPKQIIESDAGLKERESEFASDLGMRDRPTPMIYRLDEATKARIDHGDVWITELSKYLRSPSGFSTAFNPSRGSAEERVKIFNRLCTFIDQCYQECESDVFDESVPAADSKVVTADEEVVQGMRERCESSSYFDRVERRFDLAVLEFVAFKMREEILHMERVRVSMAKRSIIVYIRMRKSGYGPRVLNSFATSFPLRVASDTTVYKLRLDLATRLTRYLKNPATPLKRPSSGEPSSERTAPSANAYESSDFAPGSVFGTPEQLLIRQIPLSYECRSDTIQSARAASRFSIQLGCLDKGTHLGSAERPIVLASPKNDKEAELVADTVGDGGTVYLEWPTELAERHFDESEFESVDSHPLGGSAGGSDPEAALSIYDCIDKYCQREQLEESDMWYCNKCKELVCAWKQFQLYRCPPILIVHLKRFQYSATTHRRDKIATFVDFPLCGLDLSGRVAHWEDGEKPVYDCYAVSHHFGGLGGGHYTAHALNDDNVWCYYDDSRVTTHVDTSEVVSEAAYVLYYRRQDVSAEDFAVCLTTSEPSSPAASIGSQDGLFRDATAAVVDEDEDGMDVDVVVRQPRDVEVASTGTSSLGSRDDFQSIDEPLRVGGKKRGNSLGGSDDIFPLQ